MLNNNPVHEALTERVIGCGIKIHEYFGPGLLESVYERCMEIELQRVGMKIETDRRIPLVI